MLLLRFSKFPFTIYPASLNRENVVIDARKMDGLCHEKIIGNAELYFYPWLQTNQLLNFVDWKFVRNASLLIKSCFWFYFSDNSWFLTF